MIASYNASVVIFYNATGSLARFENKNILFYFEKRCRLLQRWRCSCKFKKIVGLGPALTRFGFAAAFLFEDFFLAAASGASSFGNRLQSRPMMGLCTGSWNRSEYLGEIVVLAEQVDQRAILNFTPGPQG
jgi:hypothetical protein